VVAGGQDIGQTLTAAVTTDITATVNSQWYRGNETDVGSPIAGATSLTYLLDAADDGAWVRHGARPTGGLEVISAPVQVAYPEAVPTVEPTM
ncbi:hypothetical protein, partial [Streptococcus pseudopneumoniae]|uniref:hypothetical protein n=1 Tax=Streptococcus pseudopneumoniae TaxID=257758 RepID=UPI0018B0BBB9